MVYEIKHIKLSCVRGRKMLLKVQQIFSNREIAYILWILAIIIVGSLTKVGRKLYKNVLPIIFCRKFILFYIVFLCFLVGIINLLHYIGFWNIYLLKDTIFWVIVVEIPIFIKALEKAKDQYFFRKLIRDNVKWIILISFIVGFWSFPLWIEILIIPIAVIGTALYYTADSDKKYVKVKKLLDNFNGVIGCYLIYFTISNLVMEWRKLYDFQTIKVFILPIILIILNMPVVYGLAVYNQYEQIFIRLKGRGEDKIRNAYLLAKESEVIRASYDNLLSRWELQSIDELYNASKSLLLRIINNREDFNDLGKEEFERIYKEKIRTSHQSEKINVFLYDTKKNIEKYISCVQGCSEELKNF